MSKIPDLRQSIANTLSDNVKSYALSEVCARLGLAGGDGEEAFRSKRKYVTVRLAGVSNREAIRIARRVLDEHHSFELEEAIAHIDDKKGRPLTEITRRDVLRTLNDVNLSGDLDLIEFLGRIWPVNDIGGDGLIFPNLVDGIRQHMYRNDDWDNDYLLERVGALDCSRSRFFRFLELVVDPLVRRGDHQQACRATECRFGQRWIHSRSKRNDFRIFCLSRYHCGQRSVRGCKEPRLRCRRS